MRSYRAQVRDSWLAVIQRAIELGDEESAERLAVEYVRRLRELGYPV